MFNATSLKIFMKTEPIRLGYLVLLSFLRELKMSYDFLDIVTEKKEIQSSTTSRNLLTE